MADERAVSEVVGFILVFSLVLGTISLVYVGGFSSLQDTRDQEQITNAERAFDVLSNNLEEIGRGEAPSRATEIKLSDAQLSIQETGNVSIFDASDVRRSQVNRSNAIVYSAGSYSRVVYEHGAVIRVDGSSSVMINEPDFVISEDRTVIRHIELIGSGQGVGGDTTALIRSHETSSGVIHSSEPTGDMTLQVNTSAPRADAWERYLESEISENDACNSDKDGGLATISCTYSTESIYVAKIKIRVHLD